MKKSTVFLLFTLAPLNILASEIGSTERENQNQATKVEHIFAENKYSKQDLTSVSNTVKLNDHLLYGAACCKVCRKGKACISKKYTAVSRLAVHVMDDGYLCSYYFHLNPLVN